MNNSIAFILFGFLLTAWTCSDESADSLFGGAAGDGGPVTYTIRAGSHHSNASVYEPLQASSLKFTARFDNTAVYQTSESENQADINKLYGMADCNSKHQDNSARFGWRWFENALEIWAYSYGNGQRQTAFITSIPLNTTKTFELSFTDSTYRFKAGDTAVSLPRQCSGEARGYKLYPYFGGDEPAPHDISIDIQELL